VSELIQQVVANQDEEKILMGVFQ
jgi:Ca2+-binding EF-hand superfamily protein